MRITIIIILSVTLSSCGILKKSVTVTKTETRFLYDSTLRVNVDGYKPIIDTKPLTDTAKVVSKTGTSIAYVDPITSEINLSFIPNDFDVEIKINTTVNEKKRNVIFNTPFKQSLSIIFIISSCIVIWYGVYYTYKKLMR